MLDSGMNLISMIIGFGMSATFIVFVCTRLIICGRLRPVDDRQMFEIDSRIDLELAEHQINRLDPVIVAAIPTMKFNREAFGGSVEDPQCTICLQEYQDKEMLRIMPKCGHSFHLSCIDTWLRKQPTCPVCRISLQDSFEAKHVTSASSQSFDSSDQQFHQWLLSDAASVDNNGSNQMHADSVYVQIDNGVAREAPLRSS